MRFLHTADWQIGMRAAHAGSAGARVREERLAAAQRVIEVARQHGAQFLLIAGDTFEDNGVERILVQKVADILARFDRPVYVIPGNHDPLIPGCVWEHPAWKSARNIHVLAKPEPVGLADCTLFPCPATARHSSRDPTAWIKSRNTHGIRIGLAHGTVEGVQQEEPDYPIPSDAATRCGLDYLALGHWHSTTTYKDAGGAVRMAYSGTHEQTKFGERDGGNTLLVEISASGAVPALTPVQTGRLRWTEVREDLRSPGDLTRVREKLESIDQPGDTLLDIRIEGLLSAQDKDELPRLEEILGSRFLAGRIDSSGLVPSPTDDSWMSGLPAGVIRQAAEKLRMLSDAGYRGPRPADATPEVAGRALLELYSLMGRGPR